MCQTHRGSFCPNTSVIWQQFEIKPMLQKTINGYSRHISYVFLSLLFSRKKKQKNLFLHPTPLFIHPLRKAKRSNNQILN